ncbi:MULTISPECIES: hypothetical protein [Staphylococcus]|uniref:hypothetical protein n=1 Tax=Staphylococcus TaxID=1279 RepID=UPI00315CC14B
MKQKLKMPNTFVILFGLLFIVWILSFIIPSGEFARKGSNDEVVANSFKYIDHVYLNILDFFMAIPKGMIETADLIFLVLIMGGP